MFQRLISKWTSMILLHTPLLSVHLPLRPYNSLNILISLPHHSILHKCIMDKRSRPRIDKIRIVPSVSQCLPSPDGTGIMVIFSVFEAKAQLKRFRQSFLVHGRLYFPHPALLIVLSDSSIIKIYSSDTHLYALYTCFNRAKNFAKIMASWP